MSYSYVSKFINKLSFYTLSKLYYSKSRFIQEILWGEIFNNTIISSQWFLDKSISPGRFAAGYPFLYALYRCLNEVRPLKILELGLGQTTKIISQYASWNKQACHIIVEHDQDWINFFQKGFTLSCNSKICKLPITYKGNYKDDAKVTAYENFNKCFSQSKFDLICIDGPFGYNAKKYSRVDILNILPNCLENSFVIFFDDAERRGEKLTIKEMASILAGHDIDFKTGVYRGMKDTFVMTSLDNKFICSL